MVQLHEEILVFNQGFWSKNHELWVDVQKADWNDVILKEEMKTTIRKDVMGFYESEALYKKLAVPWKVKVIQKVIQTISS